MLFAAIFGTLALVAGLDASSFTGFTIEASGYNNIWKVLKVYANYDTSEVNTLNVFNGAITTDDGAGFHHSDLASMTGVGSFKASYSMTIPGMTAHMADTYVTIGYGVGDDAAVNQALLDPSFSPSTGAHIADNAGWFNSQPDTEQRGAKLLVGQFVFEASRSAPYENGNMGDTPFFVFDCEIGFNAASGEMVYFGDDQAVWPEPTTATDDVHLVLGDGGKADFRGSDNGVYNMLSAKGLSVNAMFRSQDFLLHEKTVEFLKPEHDLSENALVHGTFMFGTYTAIRTASGRLLHASTEAKNAATPASIAVYENGELVQTVDGEGEWLTEGVVFSTHSGVATIETASWTIKSTVVSEPRAYFVNLEMAPRGLSALQPVAPHGVIGQSFDDDGIAVDGAIDKYNTQKGGVTTTNAQAEGAIEGAHEDYRMSSFFDTNFKYSRFDATSAKPRDAKLLKGTKRQAWTTGHNGMPAGATMRKEL